MARLTTTISSLIARHTLPREFRHSDPRSAAIHLVEAGPRVLASMPESLSTQARRHLEKLGVTVLTVGRMAAVVDLRGVHISDPIARLFWLLAHILFLIGFRNRLVVMIDWVWSYFTCQRNARIIIGRERDERGT